MRGVPANGVTCKSCGNGQGCAKDRLCGRCRMKSWPSSRKYHWTPEYDQAIKSAYRSQSNKPQLSQHLDALERKTGFPRYMIKLRAKELGVSKFGDARRPWTPAEIEVLHEFAGRRTVRQLAEKLGRSWSSEASYMEYLK